MTAVSSMSYPSYINPQSMTMINMSSLLNQKDSRWLQLEVCREFQRQKCTRCDAECKFAHPPANVEVQNGRVTACYDSIKGRCNREKPACKYFHPPQHLKDQLLINGRNHLALKNALAQQMQQQIIPGQLPTVFGGPYIGASVPTLAYSPYLVSPLLGNDQTLINHPGQQQPQQQPQHGQQLQQSKPRNDRIELASHHQLSASQPQHSASSATPFLPPTLPTHMQTAAFPVPVTGSGLEHMAAAVNGGGLEHHVALASLGQDAGVHGLVTKKRVRDSSDDILLALPTAGSGVMPYKRAASEKSGVPVYQPAGVQQQQQQQQQQAAYHQIIQLQHQQQQAATIVPATYGSTALTIPRYQ